MFTIPNQANAFNSKQSEIDRVDIDILVLSAKGSGVIANTGGECLVTATTSYMAVAVSSGTIRYERTWADVAQMSSLGISAADSQFPRFDLVCVNNVGSLSVQAGNPAASPVFPAIPSSSMVLAAVYIPNSYTMVDSTLLVDKRMAVKAPTVTIPIVTGSGEAWAVNGALTEWQNNTKNRVQITLRDFSQWRLQLTPVASLGAASARVGVQYSPQINVFTNSWFGLDNNTGAAISDAQCRCGSLTTLVSSWSSICDSAWHLDEALLRVVANSGAAQNTFFGSVYIQLR